MTEGRSMVDWLDHEFHEVHSNIDVYCQKVVRSSKMSVGRSKDMT